MTEYILFYSSSGEEWVQLEQRFRVRSAQAAIREHLNGASKADGLLYVAVPARSWKPVTVKVETKTALKFS